MGMTLKELLTKGEGTISAKEAKALAAQCRMDEETLYTLLEERGIKVLPEELIVHGKGGFLSGKNPTEEDLEAARKFANACMDKALKHEI